MTVALLFPGQASQEVGMGVALREAFTAADALFRLADEITGLPISKLCAEGPLSELTRTCVAQTAVVVTSLAAAAALSERIERPLALTAVAGHSVGELTAMCWAGAMSPEETLRLAHERGRLMERDSGAVKGAMVAVLGLDADSLERVCETASSEAGSMVQVANLNAPGQVVLSGHKEAIAAATKLALAAGAARVIPLNVGGPFHSVYMQAAATEFGAIVATAVISRAQVPVVLNTTAQTEQEPEALRTELARQISRPVFWDASLRTLYGLGCRTFIELGPGQVLTGLAKRTLKDVTLLAVGTLPALDRAADLIAAAGPNLADEDRT
ncbi:MAG: fabD [Chloroflexi bacterium]|nr:fabD [Chloroflexota bacterium]